jgi:hypothetical protein
MTISCHGERGWASHIRDRLLEEVTPKSTFMSPIYNKPFLFFILYELIPFLFFFSILASGLALRTKYVDYVFLSISVTCILGFSTFSLYLLKWAYRPIVFNAGKGADIHKTRVGWVKFIYLILFLGIALGVLGNYLSKQVGI